MSTVFKRFLNTTKAVSEFHRVSEGKATILLPEKVFYNPVQQFNRDLSIAVIRTWSKLFEKEKQGKKKKGICYYYRPFSSKTHIFIKDPYEKVKNRVYE
jgi:tRNA G26 N,N-dimethylase Trm1